MKISKIPGLVWTVVGLAALSGCGKSDSPQASPGNQTNGSGPTPSSQPSGISNASYTKNPLYISWTIQNSGTKTFRIQFCNADTSQCATYMRADVGPDFRLYVGETNQMPSMVTLGTTYFDGSNETTVSVIDNELNAPTNSVVRIQAYTDSTTTDWVTVPQR